MAPQQADRQAARNAAIAALALNELRGLWPQVDWTHPGAADAVKLVYRAVVTRYGQAAASVAAHFYDEQRTAAGLTSQFVAVPADPLPQAVTDKAVESAFLGKSKVDVRAVKGAADHVTVTDVAPGGPTDHVTVTSDLPVEQRVPARLEDSVGRQVVQPGHDTIVENTAKDPAKPMGWARVPTSDHPCAFCIMMASRTFREHKHDPGLYRSKQSAAPGSELQGTAGEKYHKHCSCIAVPVFNEPPPSQRDYRAMYEKAAANVGTHRDPKKILASMRQLYGLK